MLAITSQSHSTGARIPIHARFHGGTPEREGDAQLLRQFADPTTEGRERCQSCPVRNLSLCESLRLDELPELDYVAVKAHYSPSGSLFIQGSKDDCVHIITSGVVRQTRILPDGRRSIAGFALPGDFLGLSFEDEHAFTAEALGAVTTCRITRSAFLELIDAKPHLMRRLHAETARHLALAQDQMMMLGRLTARERLATFLVSLRNRWQRVNGQSAHVALPMTRQDIADYLGLTMETVSRIVNGFARERLIVIVPDGVRVLDFQKLEAVSAG